MTPAFRVLIMGLPGSGKTTLAQALLGLLPHATHLNADAVRAEADDWDFSPEGRARQARRMRDRADAAGGLVLADFVCPTPETRAAFEAHLTVFMDTIPAGRFPDTNAMFVRPARADFRLLDFMYNPATLAERITHAMPQGVMIGRFQPFHDGHKALLDRILERHGFATIMVRNVPASESNPLPLHEVCARINAALAGEQYRGRYAVRVAPNVAGVYYGRDVGYAVERIDLPPEVQAISATAIRREEGITLDREDA